MDAVPATVVRGAGRPKEYLTPDGKKVPGVTTILGRFKESGGLLQWAFQVGKSGASSLYEKRDEAGEVGSFAHSWVESDIHATPRVPVPAPMLERVESAFGAWREWFEGARMTIVATELPFVSARHRFGGTIDAIGRDVKGRFCLIDWKTSSGIYTDYALQLAAYELLWNEHHPGELLTGGHHICRFSKQHGDFEHRHWPELADAAEMFLLLTRAYELDRKLRDRIK